MGTIRKSKRLSIEDEKILNDYRMELLSKWAVFAKKYNIRWFLDWGTLLGLVRDGDFVRHDGDLDITIDPRTMTKEYMDATINDEGGFMSHFGGRKKEFARSLDPNDLEEWMPYWHRLYCFLKVPGQDKKIPLTYKDINVHLDAAYLWPYTDTHYFYNWDSDYVLIPVEYYDNLKTATFNGLEVFIPEKAEEYLEYIYTAKWKERLIKWGKSNYTEDEWSNMFMDDEIADFIWDGYGFNTNTGDVRILKKRDLRTDNHRGRRGYTMPNTPNDKKTKIKVKKLF